jgi:hypothetical protein
MIKVHQIETAPSLAFDGSAEARLDVDIMASSNGAFSKTAQFIGQGSWFLRTVLRSHLDPSGSGFGADR